MKLINFEIKSNVISGPRSIYKIQDFIKKNKFKKLGVVVDTNLHRKSPYLKNFLNYLKLNNKNTNLLFYELTHEPTYEYLDIVKKRFKKNKKPKVDCIIGIGGGSVIDLAKGIATLVNNHKHAKTYMGFPKNIKKSLPVIAIPTTTGTGSELAYNAVFTDDKNKIKLGINTKNNYPSLAILDPKLLVNTPFTILVNSSLGAMIRSVETYCTPKSNDVTKIFSLKAFELIYCNLLNVVKNKKDLKSWSKLQWGSYFAMVALGNSSSGPAGPISYFLSLNNELSQGLGYGLGGLTIIKKNILSGYKGYSDFYKITNNKNIKNYNHISFVNDLIKFYEKLGIKQYNNSKKHNIIDHKKLLKFLKTKKISNSHNPIKIDKNFLDFVVMNLLKFDIVK